MNNTSNRGKGDLLLAKNIEHALSLTPEEVKKCLTQCSSNPSDGCGCCVLRSDVFCVMALGAAALNLIKKLEERDE